MAAADAERRLAVLHSSPARAHTSCTSRTGRACCRSSGSSGAGRAGHLDELYGRSCYKGVGTYGFTSNSYGAPTDSYGRLVYVDGFNPPLWGSGWRRENSFLVHRPSDGGFCDALWPNRYGRTNASGYAMKYRATVDGPGVMPMMYWQGPPPGNYPASTGEGRDGLAFYHGHGIIEDALRRDARRDPERRDAHAGRIVGRQVLDALVDAVALRKR